MSKLTTLAIAALLLSACSSEDASTQSTAGTGGAAAPATCEVAQQTCVCPDGTLTGLQLCDASTGALLPCSCSGFSMSDTPAMPSTPADAGADEVMRVC